MIIRKNSDGTSSSRRLCRSGARLTPLYCTFLRRDHCVSVRSKNRGADISIATPNACMNRYWYTDSHTRALLIPYSPVKYSARSDICDHLLRMILYDETDFYVEKDVPVWGILAFERNSRKRVQSVSASTLNYYSSTSSICFCRWIGDHKSRVLFASQLCRRHNPRVFPRLHCCPRANFITGSWWKNVLGQIHVGVPRD